MVVRKKATLAPAGDRLLRVVDMFRIIMDLICLDMPVALAKQRVCKHWRGWVQALARMGASTGEDGSSQRSGSAPGPSVFDLKITNAARHLQDLLVSASYGHVPDLAEMKLVKMDTAQYKQLLYVYGRFQLWSQFGYFVEERVGPNDAHLQ